MPGWASWVISFVVKLITQYLANRRAEQALRDLGAATQAADAKTEAERQEAVAQQAAASVASTPEDPDDPFLRKD